jgi:hypothetical protein
MFGHKRVYSPTARWSLEDTPVDLMITTGFVVLSAFKPQTLN